MFPQTQYVFIHDALDEYITCGETDIPASNLKVRVSKMHKIQPSKSITGFQEQYQVCDVNNVQDSCNYTYMYMYSTHK